MFNKMTYISLFSSAGVGCYGFKMEGFECIATNEIIPRRLDIQRFNNKCKYDSGYICGDITLPETKAAITNQINLWKKSEKINGLDVLIATPPCQGMSVANHKKNEKEIVRNSLVVESIKLIFDIRPKFFIFENVPAFMKTICTDVDGVDKPIAEAIQHDLGGIYSYASRIINFKDYGACSSRSRTLVIGVRKDLSDEVSPYELFPDYQPERTLRQVIGHLPSLKTMGEICKTDIYHAFRQYPEHMRTWIAGLSEGESAFDNKDPLMRPHQIKNGVVVQNAQKNGDKYRRQFWDKTGPCVHTRNDQLASQNTIHPTDDRVFSIRELMLMMTIPYEFKWSQYSVEELNGLSEARKRAYLKKEEIKIRQSLGEAVPTVIFKSIAHNIKTHLAKNPISTKGSKELLKSDEFSTFETAQQYLEANPDNLSMTALMRLAELANTKRTENAAYYTNKSIITEIMKRLPDVNKSEVRILEPSVGVGNFLPQIIHRFQNKQITIDVVDIDERSLETLKLILSHYSIPSNCRINFIHDDFLLHDFGDSHYDYVIGNPPFGKPSADHENRLKAYKKSAKNTQTSNLSSLFLDKCVDLASVVSLVLPKAILNIPEFKMTRDYLEKMSVSSILDFGENGFKGVLVETVALIINTESRPGKTNVYSMTENAEMMQSQKYIFDSALPYWVIYRSPYFDRVYQKMQFGVFTSFRDRQITNAVLSTSGDIRVLKSRNINDSGTQVINIPGYDSYITRSVVEKMAVSKYIDSSDVYLTPNMTYKPRVMKKPAGVVVNGSVAILLPVNPHQEISERQLAYFATEEYRTFYKIARNYQTRSLNVDSNSVYFYGLLKSEEKED